MKPLNTGSESCTPISSSCVIWQGPDIECISLCKGDTVNAVVYKLATELCKMMENFNLTNYDLTCLNLVGCDPKDFQALIQLLINKICELENIPVPPPTPDGNGCPTDCIVAVDTDCFPGAATDNLLNYVDRIATRVCELASEITVIQSSIATIDITLVSLQTQIDNIPTYTLPDITLPCDISPYLAGQDVALDTLFEAFLDVWCASSGTLGDISTVLNPSCTLTGSTYFNSDIVSEPGWINPPATLADAISNIWTSICFFYNFNYAQTVVTGSGGVVVSSTYNALTNTTTYDVTTSTPLTSLMPAGAVIPWASPNITPPLGWLFCNGDVLNAADYPDLYSAIGVTYGSLGAGTFKVPVLANSIPVGIGTNSSGYDLTTVGNTGGSKAVALSAAEVAPHTHNVAGTTSGTFVDLITASSDGTTGDPSTDPRTGDYTRLKVGADGNLQQDDHAQQFSAHTHTFSAATDTGTGLTGSAHGNMQPYIVMQYIIKY